MKKFLVFLFILLISCCVLWGCQQESDVPADNTECTANTALEPDSSRYEPEGSSIDLNTVLGKTEYELIIMDPNSRKNIISRAQTNLGNLCADAYRRATDADAAIVCAAEIGAGISKGDITIANVFDVFPTESNLVTVQATGAEILDCLEIAYRFLPDECTDYMHLSGITLVLDLNTPSPVQTDEAGNFIGISGNRRVQNVQIDGVSLSAENTYTITFSNSVSRQIADMFKDTVTAAQNNVSNRSALMSYISDFLSGSISDAYKNPFGMQRVGVIPLGQTELPTAAALLPQVYLTTENSITRSEYVSCGITVHDPTGVYSDVYDTESTVKIRGNSTSAGEKAPYNIKFSDSVELLGLGKGKKWSLLANLYDKTQLRNMISFTFAQTLGVDYTSNSCFAEVYLNGEYLGLYQICEPIDVSKTKVDIDTAKNEYLLELEPYLGYSNPHCLITPSFNMILGYNEPEEPTTEQHTWLKNFITDVENAILSGDYNKVKEYVDVDSFARCYIVQELFKNVDYSQSSTRFYIKENKLYQGPVWDFDLSSGNCSQSYYPDYNNVGTSDLSYKGLWCVSLFNKYLLEYEDFRQLVSNLYAELQPIIINLYQDNELGQSRIDNLVEAHREAIDRNNTLWSTKKQYSLYEHRPVDGTYDGEIAFLKDWLEKRNLCLYEYYCSDMH